MFRAFAALKSLLARHSFLLPESGWSCITCLNRSNMSGTYRFNAKSKAIPLRAGALHCVGGIERYTHEPIPKG